MRRGLVVLSMLFWTTTSALAQVSVGVGIGLPGVSIGINVPAYPELVVVPGYPVYYAPRLHSNYFFYDGMYWVYVDDNWYASSWYNGPWALVGPEVVPVYLLRVPVRYYRAPPPYFRGWRADAPPRWGQHWGHQWEQRRSGWDRWNRSSAPAPAPLPAYQRQYSGERYPRAVEQQQALHSERYRYQPRDTVVRQHYQEHVQRAPATSQRERQDASRDRKQQDVQQRRAPQETSRMQQAPTQAPTRGPAVQEQRQPPHAYSREQPSPRRESAPQEKGKGASQEERRGQGNGKGHERGEERERGPERK